MRNNILFILACTIFAVPTLAGEYSSDMSVSADTVFFRSSAKLEFIEGETTDLQARVSFYPEQPDSNLSGIIRVDLRTLRTGIETRDGHMRENHLHTDKYQYAFFEIESIEKLDRPLPFDSILNVTINGKFFIHGVHRKVEARAEIVRTMLSDSSETIKIRASFEIKIDDFGIPRPKALFLKLAKQIEVEVIFSLFNGLVGETLELPPWPLKD